jgi:hypothetical protein
VEDGRKHPGGDADLGEEDVPPSEGVRGRDAGDAGGQAVVVRPEVGEGAEDGEGLLDAEEAVEGPFPVELDYGLGWVGGCAGRGD